MANDLGLAVVPDEEKERRYRRFMEKQQAISASILKNKVGKRLQVIVDSFENGVGRGRGRADAPEIDGSVHIASRRPLRVGDLVTVKIDKAGPYDLHGMAV